MKLTYVQAYIECKYWKEVSDLMEILLDNNYAILETVKIDNYPHGDKYRIYYNATCESKDNEQTKED